MNQPRILHIETSTKNCSVALSEGDQLVASRVVYDEKYSHAEKLHVLIKETLDETRWEITSLDAVHISKGPGSYTGLRIGVSAAKGICYSTDLPLISSTSLNVLAQQAIDKHPGYEVYIPMLDARRMEVYMQPFSPEGKEMTEITAEVIDSRSLTKWEGKKVLIFGDGAGKCRGELEIDALYDDTLLPDARFMVKQGLIVFNKQEFEDVAYFEPFYLKDFVAGSPKKLV